MSRLTLILAFFGLAAAFYSYRFFRHLVSMKRMHTGDLYLLMESWFRLVKDGGDEKIIAETEKHIDTMFGNRLFKTSLLHFDEKFISEYLKEKNIPHSEERARIFEKITRTDLTKSKQSLKILSAAFGHQFSLENYPFYNYWLVIKGNRNIFRQKKTDAQGRHYTFNDVEEPFKVLEHYFIKMK